MQNVPHDGIIEAFEALRKDRYARLLGTKTEEEREAESLEYCYETLPSVQAQHKREYVPLNGPQVLRAALAGATGTINASRPVTDSVADVIRRELGGLSGRMDPAG